MTPPLTLLPVKPIGNYPTNAFVDGPGLHGVRQVSLPTYPSSPKGIEFSKKRRKSGINLREAASVVGLRAHSVSDLELGKVTLSDADWARAFEALFGEDRRQRLEDWKVVFIEGPKGMGYYTLSGRVYNSEFGIPNTSTVRTGEIVGLDRKKGLICCSSGNFLLGDPDEGYEKSFGPDVKKQLFDRFDKLNIKKPVLHPTGYRKAYLRKAGR